eukprot:11307490-Prorocentrum_lima.AAC.1
MTSSLVGSEMCIRDRPCPPRRANGAPLPHMTTSHPPASSPPHAHVSLQSVSYTHLTLPTICSV